MGVGANIVLNFNEAVKAGSGNIEIYKTGSSTPIRSISITDSSQVSISGSTVTINPSADLAGETGYYVKLGSGVIKDMAGNSYGGISSSTAFNFTTGSVQALLTGQALVDEAKKHLNPSNPEDYYWVAGPDGKEVRANYLDMGFKGPWDCAEFVSWCVFKVYGVKVGIIPGTDQSKWNAWTNQWRADAESGSLLKIISLSEAAVTPGAIVLRRDADTGHIFISEGNGKLIEANVNITTIGGKTYFLGDNGVPIPGSLDDPPQGVDIGDVKEANFSLSTYTAAKGYFAVLIKGVSYVASRALPGDEPKGAEAADEFDDLSTGAGGDGVLQRADDTREVLEFGETMPIPYSEDSAAFIPLPGLAEILALQSHAATGDFLF